MAQKVRRREIIYKANPDPKPAASQPDGRANRSLLWRVGVLMCVCGVFLFIPLIWQLYQLQINGNDYYKELAVRNQTQDVTVSAGRGTIYDCNGNIMAMSATVYNLILSPRDAVVKQELIDEQAKEDPSLAWNVNEAIVDYLTSEFGISEERVRSNLTKTNSQYILMVSEISDEDAKEVREFIREHKLTSALYLTPTTKRFYPNNSTASHILGFMGFTETSGSEKVGSYGIEAYYEESLAGKAGRVVTAKNAAGTEMLSSYEAYMDAEQGGNVNLTIDYKIQAMAEQALETAIQKYYVQEGGTIIVMNPKTGAILAMASSPDFDPNNRAAITDADTLAMLEDLANQYGTDSEEYSKALGEAQSLQWSNKALKIYDVGSTFKPLIVAAALEEGVVSVSDTFYCGGDYKVNGVPIHCHKLVGHGMETLTGVLENSCNVGMMEIALNRMGPELFYKYLEDYGLLERTGVDIGGEDKGLFWEGGVDYLKTANARIDLASASFGQGFTVTPLRMVTSFAAVINGGHLLTPYLVESVTDSEGNVTYQRETEEVRQVLSDSTSETLRTMLESVVANGSGQNAYNAGYRIGGKTGTAEKLGTPDKDDVVCSFMGFAPANDPEILVLLAFDHPQRESPGSKYTPGGTYVSGGNIAAPTGGALISQIMDYLGGEKQYTSSDEYSSVDVVVPLVTGKTLAEAQSELEARNLTYRTVGDGDTVTGQIPGSGASIPGGSEVVLYMGAEVPTDLVTVPNLLGKSPSAVEEALRQVGLYVRATGASMYTSATSAASQTIEAGVEVSRGTVIEVRFANDAISDN